MSRLREAFEEQLDREGVIEYVMAIEYDVTNHMSWEIVSIPYGLLDKYIREHELIEDMYKSGVFPCVKKNV